MYSKELKLKRIDILCLLLFLSIVKIHAIPQIVQQGMKITFIVIILVFLFAKAVRTLWNAGLLMAIVFLVPSFIGIITGNISTKVFLDGILNSIALFTAYSFIKYSSGRGLLRRVLDDLLYIDVVACIITFFSVMSKERSLSLYGTTYVYFFGNKFSSMYIFIFLVGLLYVRLFNEKKKKVDHKEILMICIILEIFLSYWVRCSTTLVGGVVLLLTIMFSGKRTEWIRKMVANPIIAIIYMILPGFLALNMVTIMQVPRINQFVTGVLGKSAGLTGRTYIYERLVEIFQGSPVWGYGYNSDMAYKLTGVGNAQNGLFQLLLDYGIIGVIVVSILIYLVFSKGHNVSVVWGLKVFIFTMCVCSIVEVSFNYLFYLTLFIIGYSYYLEPSYASERAVSNNARIFRRRKTIYK